MHSIKQILGGTALLLLVPLVAMQFTREVAWGVGDFVAAGMLIAGTGIAYVLSTRRLTTRRARLIAGGALAAALLLVWAELAVGIFS